MPQPEASLSLMNNALDGMVQIMEELGDDRVNQRPDLAEANSPYAIVAHCVGLTTIAASITCPTPERCFPAPSHAALPAAAHAAATAAPAAGSQGAVTASAAEKSRLECLYSVILSISLLSSSDEVENSMTF